MIEHQYEGASDLARLQAALAGWTRAAPYLGYYHTGDLPHRLYNGGKGRRPPGEVLKFATRGANIVAFVHVQPEHGFFDMKAAPDDEEAAMWALQKGSSLARTMMDGVGKASDPVATDCAGDDQAHRLRLVEFGYSRGTHWGNITRRALDALAPVEVPEGYAIRAATHDDAEQLAAVHRGSFRSSWTADSYREFVMTKPGYDPAREIVVVAPDGRFAAFTVMWFDPVNRVGSFEPVGTHEEFHRRGLARALMIEGMHRMRAAGLQWAQVGHEADNPASTGLYRSLGFTTFQEVTDYELARDRS